MKLVMFSIYDSAVKAYSSPMYFVSKGQALRSFVDEVNRPDSQYGKHAADYTLFEVGEYDDSDCSIVMLPAPISLGKAIEHKVVVDTLRGVPIDHAGDGLRSVS